MPLAGEITVAGQIPGERIATAIGMADSGNFTTTETAIDSVIAPVVVGRTYRVRWVVTYLSSATATFTRARIREDTLVGVQAALGDAEHGLTSGLFPINLETEYTADVTEDKTFVGTGQVISGAGTVHAEGDATRPRLLYVEYISG